MVRCGSQSHNWLFLNFEGIKDMGVMQKMRKKIVINFLMMAHLLLVFTALAHAAAASTQTPPDDAGAMSTFLNNMDQHRRNAATHYSSLLSTITNVTRVSILSGKKQTSVLSSTSTTSPEEWIEIGENWVSSASTSSRWGGPSQWYNPLPRPACCDSKSLELIVI